MSTLFFTSPATRILNRCHVLLDCNSSCFFFNDTATTEIYTVYNTLSLHDALPIWIRPKRTSSSPWTPSRPPARSRSEEHTSELQSLYTISYAVFCLKKKNNHT